MNSGRAGPSGFQHSHILELMFATRVFLCPADFQSTVTSVMQTSHVKLPERATKWPFNQV